MACEEALNCPRYAANMSGGLEWRLKETRQRFHRRMIVSLITNHKIDKISSLYHHCAPIVASLVVAVRGWFYFYTCTCRLSIKQLIESTHKRLSRQSQLSLFYRLITILIRADMWHRKPWLDSSAGDKWLKRETLTWSESQWSCYDFQNGFAVRWWSRWRYEGW